LINDANSLKRGGGGNMENNIMTANEIEKYSMWVRINRKLAGPALIAAVLYIFFFLGSTFSILFFKIEMTNLQRMLYYLGFGLFIISSWLAFIGFLLRSVK
jgi:hypothetical protein